MENAPDAINDGRTVPLIVENGGKNCTGFLYTERIVLTAAHCLFERFNQVQWSKQYVGTPGEPYSPNSGARFLIEKTFISSNWKIKNSEDHSDTDDFAVLVLKDSIPVKGNAFIATKEQVDKYADSEAMVTNIGYGIQGPNHQQNDFTVPKFAEFPMVKNGVVEQIMTQIKNYSGKNGYYGMKLHVMERPGGPSTCPGDSGSAFYIKDGDNFMYLGALSWGFGGAPLCSGSGWKTNEMYMGSVAAYDFIYLVKEAEDYVAKQNIIAKSQETTTVQNPIASSTFKKPILKVTIKCYKGKDIKKIYGINPKCPKGYKVKV
jgi:secreted trypsin-like serine protease